MVLALSAVAWADDPNPQGQHVRIHTARGPIHVWTPAGYDASTAKIVVYVHGYYTGVDEAWRDHKLATQFELSGLNALFIACEAPRGPGDPIPWTSFDRLAAAVRPHEPVPENTEVIVVVHSGAHRTLRAWFRAPSFDTVVLIDALYGGFPALAAWVNASKEHRLIDIGELTAPWADDFHASLPETRTLDHVPSAEEWSSLRDRVIYIRSRVGHFELVTGGTVLPALLANAGGS